MTDVLHLGALLPAALGACCTVGGRRGVIDLGSALVMLAAMLDLASGAGIVHPLLWASALVILAVVSAVRLRVARRPAFRADATADSFAIRHRAAMVIHTSGGLLIMAALVCAMGGHQSDGASAGGASAGGAYAEGGMQMSTHHADGMSLAGVLITAAIAGYLALSARLVVDASRNGRRLVTVELVSMAASISAMGLAAAM